MTKHHPISSFRMTLYRAMWQLGRPLVWAYFKRRSLKDAAYGDHMGERFGYGPFLEGAVWVHATSLGELLSAEPVIRGLLGKGHSVVTTHHTPAGRQAAERLFARDIAAGTLVVRYVPLEYRSALRRFIEVCRPALVLVMEIDIWPLMIVEVLRAGVPIWLCNTQYLTKSYERDHKGGTFRGRIIQEVSGAMTKSHLHSERFRDAGVLDVVTVGETRFEQTVREQLIQSANAFRSSLAGRTVIGIVNTVEVEETGFLHVVQRLRTNQMNPIFVIVPRAPERFGPVAELFGRLGAKLEKRSELLDQNLKPKREAAFDILLGDSLGEMYFYLSLCDLVVMGGSFNPRGSHNVVEPLAVGVPVIVGPSTWTIEYPVEEAIAAGAVRRVQNADAVMPEILAGLDNPTLFAQMSEAAVEFYQTQLGATDRILTKVDDILEAKT